MFGRIKLFIQKFLVLGTAPRELWVIFAAFVCENLAYKVGSANVLTLWLSSDLGFDDKSAGAWVGTWSAILTLVTVLVGALADAMGVRRTFILGFLICIAARTTMTLATARWVVLPFGLYLQAVGIALLIPVMNAACKKYSNTAQRSLVFSLYYALMNFGYMIGDLIFDYLRGPHGLGEHGYWALPLLGTELSTYRVLIFLSLVFTIPGLVMVTLFLREGVEMTDEGVRINGQIGREREARNAEPGGETTGRRLSCQHSVRASEGSGAGSAIKGIWQVSAETLSKTVAIFASLWREPAFYRFLTLMTLAVGVRMIFPHLFFTFPKYAIRELGEGSPFAHLSGFFQSLLIVFLVPICGVLTQKISAYRMVMVGSWISALSVFLIALPPMWFKPLADGWMGELMVHRWLGIAGPVNPLWISIFLFILVLSIGEALWSPRLYEYAAAVAPKDQEASYMALSLLPMFAAKFVVGGLSGWLLATFCPAQGPRHSEFMWFLIGCMALITPVGTFLFRKQIQVQESGRDLA